MRRAILVVDHGSKHPGSGRTVMEAAALLRQMVSPETVVEYAHMEFAEPTIAQGFARCVEAGAQEIVVQPFMLAPGRHATADVPNLAAQAAEKFPHISYRVAFPLGAHPKIVEVMLQRYEEALAS